MPSSCSDKTTRWRTMFALSMIWRSSCLTSVILRLDGRKIILIYRPSLLPDRQRLFEIWRARARELGIGEILICNAMTFGEFDPRDVSCDAAVEFPPHTVSTMELPLSDLEAPATFMGKVYDYVDAMRSSLGKTYDFPYFPAVMPRWDNTPRKGSRGHVFNRSSPEAFEVWLRDATSRARKSSFAEPIVFINSWNEWAEGGSPGTGLAVRTSISGGGEKGGLRPSDLDPGPLEIRICWTA